MGGRESSTVKKYCLSLRGLLAYANLNDREISLPLDSATAAEYLTFLKHKNRTVGAIDTALAALKWAHSFIPGMNKWNNPMNDEFIARIVSDARRHLKGAKNIKKPITGDMVQEMTKVSNLDHLVELRNCLIVSLAYSLILRNDEVSHTTCDHFE